MHFKEGYHILKLSQEVLAIYTPTIVYFPTPSATLCVIYLFNVCSTPPHPNESVSSRRADAIFFYIYYHIPCLMASTCSITV